MARPYNQTSIQILLAISNNPKTSLKAVYDAVRNRISQKDFYNLLFRFKNQNFITHPNDTTGAQITLTKHGQQLLRRLSPERDGIWKLVIFDIPEKQKYVRAVLRAKLKSLHFKKWQNSIWVSPYKLDDEIEEELKELSKKFFIRLIKTTEINNTNDLEKLFAS